MNVLGDLVIKTQREHALLRMRPRASAFVKRRGCGLDATSGSRHPQADSSTTAFKLDS
jgi:hypothetical protein